MKMINLETRSVKMSVRKILNEDTAKKIVKIIETMPDEGISVTWRNVIFQVKKYLDFDFQRNVLSSKNWDNRRLIFEAYVEAKSVDRRMRYQERPKYAHSSKEVLLDRIGRLEQDLEGLQVQLTQARMVRFGHVDLYRIRREDLPLQSCAFDEASPSIDRTAVQTKGSGGRSEVLTRQIAIQICALIRKMPEEKIAVTWDNVISKIFSDLKFTFRRNVLSQKEWDGRKLLAEAFREAKLVQGNLSEQEPPGDLTVERHSMQARRAALEAKADALALELANERLKQLAVLELFRQQRFDLRSALPTST